MQHFGLADHKAPYRQQAKLLVEGTISTAIAAVELGEHGRTVTAFIRELDSDRSSAGSESNSSKENGKELHVVEDNVEEMVYNDAFYTRRGEACGLQCPWHIWGLFTRSKSRDRYPSFEQKNVRRVLQ